MTATPFTFFSVGPGCRSIKLSGNQSSVFSVCGVGWGWGREVMFSIFLFSTGDSHYSSSTSERCPALLGRSGYTQQPKQCTHTRFGEYHRSKLYLRIPQGQYFQNIPRQSSIAWSGTRALILETYYLLEFTRSDTPREAGCLLEGGLGARGGGYEERRGKGRGESSGGPVRL